MKEKRNIIYFRILKRKYFVADGKMNNLINFKYLRLSIIKSEKIIVTFGMSLKKIG